jgi:hypothetical protein
VFEEELGLESGIGSMEADEAEVSPGLFEDFVCALLAWRARTAHAVIHALSDGFIATCVVLADRAGASLRWPEPAVADVSHDPQAQALVTPGESWQARVREQAAELAGFMSR